MARLGPHTRALVAYPGVLGSHPKVVTVGLAMPQTQRSGKRDHPGQPSPTHVLEVLRKLWIWIYIRKIVHLWESHQTLTHSQHGFRRGHGTDSALMVHLNCIEHARLTSAPLFLSSWDIRRAFDSVTNESFGCKLAPVGRTSGHCPLDCSPRRPMPYCSSVPVGLGSLKSGGICRSTRRPFRDAPWYFCPGTGHPTG